MSELPTRTLGRTGLEVTVLGFGAMELRDPPKGRAIEEREAGYLLNSVLDAGINFIDTSPDYGRSEERIGRHLAARRDEFYLASKAGCPTEGDPLLIGGSTPHDYTPSNLRAGVERSLDRLQTDYLDVLQLHMSPSIQRLRRDDTLDAMAALRDEGKVRFLGMSGVLPHLADHISLGFFDVFQIPYSVVEPEHGAWISHAARAGAGVIVRGGVGKGVPSGNQAGRGAARLAANWERADLEEVTGALDPMEFALRYTISHPHVSTTVVGTLTVGHLRDNVAAASRGPLPADVYAEAGRRVAALHGD